MSKVELKKEDAKHIADLVNLDISGEEEKYAEMLSETLNYIEVLDELDTHEVSETYQVTGLTNVFQKGGEQEVTLTQKESLSNASDPQDNLFGTSAVFDR